jgi:glycosyltransferase involved in cell wall biosynthesis
MKIGIDARFFGTAGKGLGRYTEKLIRELEAQENDDTYRIFLYGEGYDAYEPKNPRFTKVRVSYKWYGFGEQLLYPFFLWRQGIDLMHFPHFNVPMLYRRPFVVTIHDLILLRYPTQKASTHSRLFYRCKYWVYQKVIASAIARARRVLVVSQFTAQDVTALYPQASNKLLVTREGVDQQCVWTPYKEVEQTLQQLWQRAGRTQTDRYFVLYVGNAYPHKNLEAFLELAQAESRVDIVLVGRPDYFYQRLKARVEAEGITNIYFLGGVTDRELAFLYRGARLYVFPSLYEGFGLPPLEAMQYNLPVLSSDKGSLPEIIGTGGILVDIQEKEVLVAKYQAALWDEALREKLRTQGRVQAAKFSWQTMAAETKAAYNESSI